MGKVMEKIKSFFCAKFTCRAKKEDSKLPQEKPQAKDKPEEQK